MIGLSFDTETTGLPKHPNSPLGRQPKIIEFGGILFNQSGEISRLSILIDPQEEITEEITGITGITNEMLKGQPTFEQALPEIAQFMAQADIVFAHNLPFDKSLMEFDLRRIDKTLKDANWPQRECCTVAYYRKKYGRRVKLINLYKDRIGKKLDQTHRAVDDCEALLEIVLKDNLIEKLSPTASKV